jgi:hypothetical protein
MSKIGLPEQITAVERSVVNLRGTIAQLQDMARLKRADPIMIGIRESHLIELEAALKTLKWVYANHEKIRNALK